MQQPGNSQIRIEINALWKFLSIFVLGLFAAFCLIPFLIVISTSFTGESAIIKYGYSIFPRDFTFEAYKLVFFKSGDVFRAYIISIIVATTGTFVGVLISSMLGYVLARRDYPLANKTSLFVFFTMLFSGGLVPWYILIAKQLRLSDTIFALIAPYLVQAWFVFLLKGYFNGFNQSIIEGAKIDGASEYRIFFRIVLPICKPGLATVSLFYLLMYWNDYYLSLMFIQGLDKVSLQYLMFRVLRNAEFVNSIKTAALGAGIVTDSPEYSLRFALCVIAAGPMLLIFPFFQKYFEKGISIGSVKS